MILPQRLLDYRSMNANHIYIGLRYSLLLFERKGIKRMFQFSKKIKIKIKIDKFFKKFKKFRVIQKLVFYGNIKIKRRQKSTQRNIQENNYKIIILI